MVCPLKCQNPDCKVCPFSKQGLCDAPYIGSDKWEIKKEV